MFCRVYVGNNNNNPYVSRKMGVASCVAQIEG